MVEGMLVDGRRGKKGREGKVLVGIERREREGGNGKE